MEITIGIVLIGILSIHFTMRLLMLRSSIRRINRELTQIASDLEENRVVKLPVPEKEMEALLVTMNRTLKEIREQRISYQKKEQQLKEQIENISHDLRTPLTAILGYLKMIDTEGLDDEGREYLGIAIAKSQTLQKLVSQFYELSCVTSDNFHLKQERVDVARLLRECCLEHYPLFEQEKKELQIDIPEVPVVISADGDALARVFENLLQNSIRYARSGLWITLNQEEGSITFLNDIHPGQEVSDPNRLFDRFYMQKEARNQGGSGLGLTISKYLTQLMGGTMEAEYATKEGKRYLIFRLRWKA